MKTATTAVEAFRKVQRHVELIKNDDGHIINTCSPGDMWVQGDVGIACLDAIPEGAVPIKAEAQLAPGVTQGSRHCVYGLTDMRMFRLADPTPLDGPVIEALQGFTVTHPEHGDITLPAGVYGVIYQRAFADELRRVLD